MFKVIADLTFRRDVTVAQPDGTDQVLTTVFRALPRDTLAAFDAHEIDARELLERAVVDFEGLVDPEGTPVSGPEWRAKVLDDMPWTQPALFRAFLDAMAGVRAGNSAPSAGTGQPAG